MRLFMTASSSSQSSSFEIMKLMRYGWWIIFVSIILYFIYFILQILLKDNICFDKLSNKNKNNTKNSNMSWNRSYNIGIFLIIRNAMPTSSYVFLSYIYTVFATTPVLLQIFSIINTIITTMSCWLYGKLLSRYHTSRATTKSDNDNNSNAIENNGAKYRQFKLVIVGTTILACLASLLNLIFVHMFSTTPSKSSTSTNQLPFVQKVIWTLIINAIITFTSEFMFMPDVVLATLASVDDDIDDIDKGDDYQKEYNYTSDRVVCRCVVVRDEVSTTMPCEDIMSTQTSLLETSRSEKNDIANDKDESTVYLTVQHEDEEQRQQQCRHVNDDDDEEEVLEDDTSNEHTNQNYDTMMIGSKYSSLISCIDFGGQIGALIIGPIISIIGTSRENNWEHIDHFIIICSIAMLFPLLFLRMIR